MTTEKDIKNAIGSDNINGWSKVFSWAPKPWSIISGWETGVSVIDHAIERLCKVNKQNQKSFWVAIAALLKEHISQSDGGLPQPLWINLFKFVLTVIIKDYELILGQVGTKEFDELTNLFLMTLPKEEKSRQLALKSAYAAWARGGQYYRNDKVALLLVQIGLPIEEKETIVWRDSVGPQLKICEAVWPSTAKKMGALGALSESELIMFLMRMVWYKNEQDAATSESSKKQWEFDNFDREYAIIDDEFVSRRLSVQKRIWIAVQTALSETSMLLRVGRIYQNSNHEFPWGMKGESGENLLQHVAKWNPGFLVGENFAMKRRLGDLTSADLSNKDNNNISFLSYAIAGILTSNADSVSAEMWEGVCALTAMPERGKFEMNYKSEWMQNRHNAIDIVRSRSLVEDRYGKHSSVINYINENTVLKTGIGHSERVTIMKSWEPELERIANIALEDLNWHWFWVVNAEIIEQQKMSVRNGGLPKNWELGSQLHMLNELINSYNKVEGEKNIILIAMKNGAIWNDWNEMMVNGEQTNDFGLNDGPSMSSKLMPPESDFWTVTAKAESENAQLKKQTLPGLFTGRAGQNVL